MGENLKVIREEEELKMKLDRIIETIFQKVDSTIIGFQDPEAMKFRAKFKVYDRD